MTTIWLPRIATTTTSLLFTARVSIYISLSPVVSSKDSSSSSSNCNFRAIYNFGDSNSDTGSVSAIYGPIPPPHGLGTFFRKPSGRWSDGRLMIDFIANKLGFPFLSGYLDSIGANYRYGANFAMSGSTIELTIIDGRFIDAGFNQISYTNEIGQFEQFKNRTTNIYNQRGSLSSLYRHILPNPNHFSRAIYIIDIGQNDLSFWLTKMGETQTLSILPDLIKNFTLSIPRLYKQGARTFWIHNTGPIGCLPIYVNNNKYRRNGKNLDKIGCIKSFNRVAKEFNRLLKEQVMALNGIFHDAWFSYVDIYSARYSLTKQAEKYGFKDPVTGFCAFNGTMCGNPEQYISWDSIHFTEATNYWVTKRIVTGRFCYPPVPITQACHWRH